jgi:hypothetical protein
VFDKAIQKLQRLKDALADTYYLPETKKAFVRRQLSMQTAFRQRTKRYSEQYYKWRVRKLKKTNLYHDYERYKTLHSTLVFYVSRLSLFGSSAANYLSYLHKGFVGKKYYKEVEDAFRVDDLKSIILRELKEQILRKL